MGRGIYENNRCKRDDVRSGVQELGKESVGTVAGVITGWKTEYFLPTRKGWLGSGSLRPKPSFGLFGLELPTASHIPPLHHTPVVYLLTLQCTLTPIQIPSPL